MTFPEPVIGLAIEPKTQKDLDKLGIALNKLGEEDPTFKIHTDHDSGQTIISGMGELHLEIIVDRLRREFNVEITQGAPQVNYKETLKGSANHRETFKKQSGGKGKFADIIITIGAADAGVTGLQFVDEVKGGNIPREFIPSIQKGFETSMKNGVLAGYVMDSMKVVLKDGSFHAVDSDALSFEICARYAFRHAAVKAIPVLLEPIMAVEVVTPEENMGDIIGDFNKRRGQITGMESRGGARVVKAKVPLSEMFGYVTVLRTISSGRATSSMEFSHFEEVSANQAKDIVEKATGKIKEIEQYNPFKQAAMSQKIRIKLKSYDHSLVDKSAEKIVKTVKATGAIVSGPIPLPTHKKIFTVNRSTFVNKKSREQFELSTFKRLLDIYSSTPKTIDALMKLELPSGVEVEIKV